MQQRQLRLGDVLDDYCPRERRITDHAIVAMVGDVVKQTRCTTCEAEHEYKHAKAPTLRKKKEAPAALSNEVAAGVEAKGQAPSPPAAPDPRDETMTPGAPGGPVDHVPQSAQAVDQGSGGQSGGDQGGGVQGDPNGGPETPASAPEEEGPVHRRLIRATLPRTEGQPPAARPLPDFTVRRPGNRPGGYPSFRDRDRGGMGNRPNNGSRGGGFGRSAGPKLDFGRPGRGDSRPGRRSHGPRRGGGGGGKKH